MNAAFERTTKKLRPGTLPAYEPVKRWGGPGSGATCDGCDLVVTSKESEHEMEMPSRRVLRSTSPARAYGRC